MAGDTHERGRLYVSPATMVWVKVGPAVETSEWWWFHRRKRISGQGKGPFKAEGKLADRSWVWVPRPAWAYPDHPFARKKVKLTTLKRRGIVSQETETEVS